MRDKFTVCGPAFSLMVRLAIVLSVGCWLTPLTVTLNVRVIILLLAVTVKVWLSLVAPDVMPDKFTVCGPAFSLMVRLAIVLSVGCWLTPLTVTLNVRVTILLLAPPSLTVTVI